MQKVLLVALLLPLLGGAFAGLGIAALAAGAQTPPSVQAPVPFTFEPTMAANNATLTPPGQSGNSFYWVGANSFHASTFSNSGIQAEIGVVGTPVTGCLSFWVADEMNSDTIWGQVGYYICNGSQPVAFYQIWQGGSVAVTGTASVSEGDHLFSMFLVQGTTWGYALDGEALGSYDMGSSASSSTHPVEAFSEEGYVAAPFDPPRVEFDSVQVLNGGVWAPIQTSYQPYGCANSSYSCWGVQGNLQNSSLCFDCFVVGGSTPEVPQGTLLGNASMPMAMSISTTGASTTTHPTAVTSTSARFSALTTALLVSLSTATLVVSLVIRRPDSKAGTLGAPASRSRMALLGTRREHLARSRSTQHSVL